MTLRLVITKAKNKLLGFMNVEEYLTETECDMNCDTYIYVYKLSTIYVSPRRM